MIEDSQRLMKFLINQIIDGNVKPMGDMVFYTTPNAGDFISKNDDNGHGH
jgi:hypothetical protein